MAQNTYRQALVSTDVDFLKKVRSSYKGRITRYINALQTALVKVSDLFDHENIDSDEVHQIVDEIKADQVVISELHIRFEVLRVHPEDSLAEEKLIKADNDYISEVETKIRGALRLYNSYMIERKAKADIQFNQNRLAEEVKQYPAKLHAFKIQKSEYDSTHLAAQKVVISENDSILRTAAHYKLALQNDFEKLVALGKDLLDIVPNVSNADKSDLESFECSKTKLGHTDLMANLEKVSREVEFNDRIAVAKVAKPSEVSSFVGAYAPNIEKTKIVKLKVTPPTFSGKCREFAVFKRDFQTIVDVADRSDVEIGALLKESVPSRWKYLLDKVELSNHKEMMTILTAKFGRARIIIDECTSEIRKMKVINSDSEFIAFVDHIDKIKRDLEQLNLLSDIANTTVIADLESKLPYGVKRDWIKCVSSKCFGSHI